MSDASVGEELRRLRREAALSQRELAAVTGVPQPNIAAYESGRRQPSPETLVRLGAALRAPSLDRVRASRGPILEVAARRRLSDVRVFGSVARGDAAAGSDLDLLVHPAADASLFDLAGFMAEVAALLGIDVDVVSDRGSGPMMDRIRAEAVAL
ncbi:helix-turn-helix domain-containing protein [Clavibacter sepedonicus]|uniref:DNA-binding protein n=1 Tax=Clavibacter sepedonicus TaxID=31964 RepID=B0RBG9_CLASE|nr:MULTISPECIES: XRE family transcriptional regulator [Clavibacter]MBD5380676.1 XRE family transcriptional regulator [Clavibacter sp.]OQJ48390.1 Cro/Cl family transcriptional regulator [Clavibacter sepedonicus]OQJ53872.1 Cro/Cl family transcriptional regulator [Clavibacter sepedonicus]UUK65387.1 XRE family transcriptional regulator [Clavibacter sepedonicus]CAQ02865.1 putative DNA-binding protein [Clavibacter sepedonicus]